MFVFGGGTGWSGITYNDVFALDTTAMIWHAPAVTGKPPEPRAGHTAALIGSKIVIVGGGDHKRAFSDVHVLDTDAMSWSRPSVAGDLPSGRAGHSATAVGDLLIVFGGGSPQGALHNDLFVLDSGAHAVWIVLSVFIEVYVFRLSHSQRFSARGHWLHKLVQLALCRQHPPDFLATNTSSATLAKLQRKNRKLSRICRLLPSLTLLQLRPCWLL
jgi:Galactose oxidase, central domain